MNFTKVDPKLFPFVKTQAEFLGLENPYRIDTRIRQPIEEEYMGIHERPCGVIEWHPDHFELLPVLSIFNSVDIPENDDRIYQIISDFQHNATNATIRNYLLIFQNFFEEERKIPEDWKKYREILFLGTMNQRRGNGTHPFVVHGLSGNYVSLTRGNLNGTMVLVHKGTSL